MSWTRHGHHIPGTVLGNSERPLVVHCGGSRICQGCAADTAIALTAIIFQKGVTMEFTEFVRKPFVVEAIEITTENITEIADFIGILREKEDGTPFISVDRRLIPNVYRVFPGFWMTRMGDNIRCYSKKIFLEQFTPNSDVVKEGLGYFKVSS